MHPLPRLYKVKQDCRGSIAGIEFYGFKKRTLSSIIFAHYQVDTIQLSNFKVLKEPKVVYLKGLQHTIFL